MKPLGWKRVLVLAPHTDDEIACAATIARAVEEGAHVHVMAFSDCGVDGIRSEWDRALDVLGVQGRSISNRPNRTFGGNRQEILDMMCDERRLDPPDVVLCPSSTDTHQDHRVIHEEAIRAFRGVRLLLGYQCPWNQRVYRIDVHVEARSPHVLARTRAAECYQSQLQREHIARWWTSDSLYLYGAQGRAGAYAEAFELLGMRL